MSQPKDLEFEMLQEAAEEAGLRDIEFQVERIFYTLKGTQRKVSAVKWGTGEPDLVLFHGGAQNARTWDTVAMALGLDILAVDLPGHGLSDWRDDHTYSPVELSLDMVEVIGELAPNASGAAGMSLGGLTALFLADKSPELVKRLMLVDITPGVNRAKAEPILEFISGPQHFDSFQEILDYTIKFNPTRSESSLRRGVLNNAKETEDGKWTWRWDPTRIREEQEISPEAAFGSGWEALERVQMPVILYRGGESGVVDDEDVAELSRRCPNSEVVLIPGAGHSIQGDKPLELAELIRNFLNKS